MARAKVVEAMPILVSSSLGLLYTLLFAEKRDVVLIVIFCLIVVRSAAGLLRSRDGQTEKGEE